MEDAPNSASSLGVRVRALLARVSKIEDAGQRRRYEFELKKLDLIIAQWVSIRAPETQRAATLDRLNEIEAELGPEEAAAAPAPVASSGRLPDEGAWEEPAPSPPAKAAEPNDASREESKEESKEDDEFEGVGHPSARALEIPLSAPSDRTHVEKDILGAQEVVAVPPSMDSEMLLNAPPSKIPQPPFSFYRMWRLYKTYIVLGALVAIAGLASITYVILQE